MPWKECHLMDERLRFVARLLEGEKMAPLCAEFGISRKTGYKIFDRYKDCCLEALTDRSGQPFRHANRLPAQLEAITSPAASASIPAGKHQRSARGGSASAFTSSASSPVILSKMAATNACISR